MHDEPVTFPFRTARRDRGLPAGRIPHDIGAPVQLPHTLQSEDAVCQLLSAGRIVADPARA